MSCEQRNADFCKAQTDVQMAYIEAEREVNKLKAENERLRSCLSDAAENRRLVMGEYKQLREENERLRQELATRDEFEHGNQAEHEDAAKRLRGLADNINWNVCDHGGLPYELRSIANEIDAENAKLRAERDYFLMNSNPTAAELRRVRRAWKNDRDENAKLRELIADVHEALKADRAGMFHRLTLTSMEDDMRELGISIKEIDG